MVLLEIEEPKINLYPRKVDHDKEDIVFITISKGKSSTIEDLWDIHFIFYNEENKIYRIEERLDTLHLAEGNIGPRI